MTRFYIQMKEDPHGSVIALFISNLPLNLSQRQYAKILLDKLGPGMSKPDHPDGNLRCTWLVGYWVLPCCRPIDQIVIWSEVEKRDSHNFHELILGLRELNRLSEWFAQSEAITEFFND